MPRKHSIEKPAGDSLTLVSFDNPVPSKKTHAWNRDRNLGVIYRYVIEGEPLEEEALDDMFKNPEVLSYETESLEGWVKAAASKEDAMSAEHGAAERLEFLKIILGWSVELGYGSTDFYPDRTSGNGCDGLAVCTSPRLDSQDRRTNIIPLS
ncbi:MAG TPA: hypothetical protein VFH99_01720 [Candidatus Saccharimonadales bacterium]|nr:hypothetical protein [Candidatus Saccharimonadales bacterium]